MPFDLIFPSKPEIGQVYTGETGISWAWDGVKWISRRSNASRVFIGPDAPPSHEVEPGDLWFDPVSIQLFVWYVDPTSAQWVVTVNNAMGTGLDEVPLDGRPYVRSNAAWHDSSNFPIDGGYF